MYKSWMWKQRSYREQFQGDEGGGAAGGAGDSQDDGAAAETNAAGDEQDQAAEQQNDDQDAAAEEDGEVVVMIGDEAPPVSEETEVNGAPAPQWLKDLRKSDREKSKRIRELEQAAAAREAAAAAPAAQVVGEKPTLEQFEFDAEKYADALVAWNDRKKAADAQEAAARQEQEAAQAAWKQKLDGYNKAKAALRVDDFDGAEHVVSEALSPTQQGVILNGADKPELLVYALGRNPAKAKELAAIKDPVKFAFAVAKLETQLKVAPRKDAPPAPERQVRGTAGGGVGVDNQLTRLQAEADRTGDRSKVAAYLREQNRRNAA